MDEYSRYVIFSSEWGYTNNEFPIETIIWVLEDMLRVGWWILDKYGNWHHNGWGWVFIPSQEMIRDKLISLNEEAYTYLSILKSKY